MKDKPLVTVRKIHERIREVVKWVDDFWVRKCPACGGIVRCDSELKGHCFIRIAFQCEVCNYIADITLLIREPRVKRGREASLRERGGAGARAVSFGRAREYVVDGFYKGWNRQGSHIVKSV